MRRTLTSRCWQAPVAAFITVSPLFPSWPLAFALVSLLLASLPRLLLLLFSCSVCYFCKSSQRQFMQALLPQFSPKGRKEEEGQRRKKEEKSTFSSVLLRPGEKEEYVCVQELGRKQTFVVTSLLPNSGWKERKKERSWLSRQSCYCRQGERNKKTRRPLLHLAPPPILLHLLHGLVVLGISPDCFDFLLGPLFLPSLPSFLFFFFSFSRVCFLPLFCFRVRILSCSSSSIDLWSPGGRRMFGQKG